MTSFLANPVAGYRTFCRFESFSCLPWTSIVESMSPALQPALWLPALCLKEHETQNRERSLRGAVLIPKVRAGGFDNLPPRHVLPKLLRCMFVQLMCTGQPCSLDPVSRVPEVR